MDFVHEGKPAKNGFMKNPEYQLKQTRRMKALASIDRAIISAMDLDIFADVVFDQINQQLGAEICFLYLRDQVTSEFICRRSRGVSGLSGINRTMNTLELDSNKPDSSSKNMVVFNELKLTQARERLPYPYDEYNFYSAVQLSNANKVIGILEVCSKDPIIVDNEWKEYLSMIAGQATIGIEHLLLIDNINNLNNELIDAYESTLLSWAKALEYKDQETKGHSDRVTKMSLKLGKALGLTEEELVQLRRGAILHDIGKMCIPDKILLKKGPLTEDEWELMKRHPILAQEFLSDIQFIQPALNIPLFHHERWDGSGYPYGLKGKQIPLAVRIFMVVDVWDALSSTRSYREAWSFSQVEEYFQENSGKLFDPIVVLKFLELQHEHDRWGVSLGYNFVSNQENIPVSPS
jgi:HD-GYP domain-containing protein (c-di-GMP phosphodiesterase class II)